MNVNGTSPRPMTMPAPVQDRRAALQALLLKKSLELQNQETEAVMREAEGKGQRIDIRV